MVNVTAFAPSSTTLSVARTARPMGINVPWTVRKSYNCLYFNFCLFVIFTLVCLKFYLELTLYNDFTFDFVKKV